MSKPPNTYTAADIPVLHGLEPVRKRPCMYLGGTGSLAWHHMLFWAIDEMAMNVMSGYPQSASIRILGNRCKISTLGPLPVHVHAGTKSEKTFSSIEEHLWSLSNDLGDLHYRERRRHFIREDIAITRALSNPFIIRYADGAAQTELAFEEYDWQDKGELTKSPSKAHRLEIEFEPDFKILGQPEGTTWNREKILKRLHETCAMQSGFRGYLDFEGQVDDVNMPNGLAEYLQILVPEGSNIQSTSGSQGELKYTLAFADSVIASIISYANTVETKDGGSHVKALVQVMEKFGISLKNKTIAISVTHPHPKFLGPTKDKLNAKDLEAFILEDLPQKLK